jgi:hypothetical protein
MDTVAHRVYITPKEISPAYLEFKYHCYNTTMSATPVYSIDLPEYVSNFFKEQGGISIVSVSRPQLLAMCNQSPLKHLIVYEQFVVDHTETLMNLLEQQRVESLTIYKHHSFTFTNALMDRLNTFAMTTDIKIIVNGYYENNYRNIKIYHADTYEHALSHEFVLLLSKILHKKRRPTKKFLIQTVSKDYFRKTVSDHLRTSAIWSDFIAPPRFNSRSAYENFFQEKKRRLFQQFVENNNQRMHGLNSFGPGLPNFKMYELAFCELILETRNSGSWHFTEKTFRPIALGIPVVHLGHKPVHDRLLAMGYRLYDKVFYEQWHKDVALEKKLLHLENFLTHIKNDKSAQAQMEEIAQYNYQHFWNHRKNHYYTTLLNLFDDMVGENSLTHKIYKHLDF